MRPYATSVCGLKLLVYETFSHKRMSAISLAIQETCVSQKAPDDMLYDDILHNITGANEFRLDGQGHDVKGRADCLPPGTQFTCFTSTKVQILTSKDEQLAYLQVLSLLA